MRLFKYDFPTITLKKVIKSVPAELKLVLPKQPEIQKVVVTNPPDPVMVPPVKFPEVQKVHVENQPAPVNFPTKMVVHVDNPTKPPDTQKVHVENQVVIPEPKFPDFKKMFDELRDGLQKIMPINEGNRPGKADPTKYVPVRLTNGEKFYSALKDAYTAASASVPGSILLGYVVTGQAVISSGGVAVQLPSGALKNGVIISARSTNSGDITIGNRNVTNTEDGTGSGYILEPGSSVSYGVTNTNVIWINGSTGDVVSWSGS
jgi:hypothetical protein